MDIEDFKPFEKKAVTLVTNRDAIYNGIMTPVYTRKGKYKVKLNQVVICDKAGNYKAIGGHREFNCGSVKDVKPYGGPLREIFDYC